MTDKLESPLTNKEPAASHRTAGNPLTEAQLVIAQLLGRVLAHRWRDENRSPSTSLSAEANED